MTKIIAMGLTAALVLAATARAQEADPTAVTEPVAEKAATTGDQAAPVDPADDWTLRWNNSFRLTRADGAYDLRFGGRVQNDWAAISGDDRLEAAVGGLDGGTEFRRARLFVEGRVHQRFELKAQYDFAGGAAELKDVYLGVVDLPVVGGVRVGHFKEPWSLEEQTSSKYLTFMERALPVEAFSPSRNAGFMLHDAGERWTWAVGVFKDSDDFGDAPETEEWAWTGRLTGLAWAADDSHLLHLGAAASRRDPVDGVARFRSRPESHLAPRFVDTGALAADGVSLLGAEAAWVQGPFSLQGEWSRATVEPPAGNDADVDGFYVSASWFPTGESRPYDQGSFGRVRPRRPWGTGPGAWELALRWSEVDLSADTVDGGELQDLTLGLNWYPHPNLRWMLDYVRSELAGVGGADVIQTRFQVDF